MITKEFGIDRIRRASARVNVHGCMAVLTFIVVLGFAIVLPTIYYGRVGQDFDVYYHAAVASRLGLDPYAHAEFRTPYQYPPWTLFLFYPFTLVGLPHAYSIFVGLKILSILFILLLWIRIFQLRDWPILVILVPFAFGSSLLVDLRAGNISAFEQLLIWTGFYFYVQNKITKFATAICAAASFKLMPILLLGLLATRLRRKEVVLMIVFGFTFCMILVGNA